MSDNEIKINRGTAALLVTVCLFLAAQTIAAVVYGARIGAKQEAMAETLGELKRSNSDAIRLRYTSEDASRDRSSVLDLISAVNRRIDLSEKRIERLEEQKP